MSDVKASDEVTSTQRNSPTNKYKYLAYIYLIGGIFGALDWLSTFGNSNLSFAKFLTSLLLLTQIVIALFGSFIYLKKDVLGLRLLHLLSWMSIPLIGFGLLSYWLGMGLGIFTMVTVGGGFSFDFWIRFGYFAQAEILPGYNGLTVGINLFALALTASTKLALKSEGVEFSVKSLLKDLKEKLLSKS